jgi:uncharacterized protein (DUF924 family)
VIHGVKAQDVHRFWFEDATADPRAAQARNGVWFGASADFDAVVRQRFEPAIDTAARGELASWENAPQSCVSLVIVLDQFPRNVHRASPGAFAYDALALAVTKRAIAAGHLDALSEPERAFLLMPYQHVEDAAAQREGAPCSSRCAPTHRRRGTRSATAYCATHTSTSRSSSASGASLIATPFSAAARRPRSASISTRSQKRSDSGDGG